jgi:hypothetical protein
VTSPQPLSRGEGTGRLKRRLCFANVIIVELLMIKEIKLMWKIKYWVMV